MAHSSRLLCHINYLKLYDVYVVMSRCVPKWSGNGTIYTLRSATLFLLSMRAIVPPYIGKMLNRWTTQTPFFTNISDFRYPKAHFLKLTWTIFTFMFVCGFMAVSIYPFDMRMFSLSLDNHHSLPAIHLKHFQANKNPFSKSWARRSVWYLPGDGMTFGFLIYASLNRPSKFRLLCQHIKHYLYATYPHTCNRSASQWSSCSPWQPHPINHQYHYHCTEA